MKAEITSKLITKINYISLTFTLLIFEWKNKLALFFLGCSENIFSAVSEQSFNGEANSIKFS